MSGEEKYNQFLENIENWIKSSAILDIAPNEDVIQSLNMNRKELSNLSHDECLEIAYELYAYSEYLHGLLAKEKIALQWAEDSIWYIISDKMDQYGGKFTKWQEKYFRCVKENPLASQIIKVKNNALARVEVLTAKVESVKRLSDILYSLSKRR